MKKIIITMMVLIGYALPIRAQYIIKGKVIDAVTKQPLQANIKFKLAKYSTVAENDGSFTLGTNVENDTLIVSCLSYFPRIIPIKGHKAAPLLILLEEHLYQVDNVVISTGYYQLPRERITGSVTQVNEKALNTSVSTDIISRLKGVANGISFDERIPDERKLNIRGISTINGDTQPLIVLNNFPYDGDINSINPNDVESITVLKDAAAASIWGVRAANGVIVINTKKGRFNAKQEISFNSNISVEQKPDVYALHTMSSADYIGVEKFLFNNGFYASMEVDPAHPALSPVVEQLIANRDGRLSNDQLNASLNALGKLDVRDQFNKYLYQKSINQQYALNLNGGTATGNYFYSLGYDHNINNLAARYSRFSFRADNNFTIGYLKVNPVISYARTSQQGGRPSYIDITPGSGKGLYPYAQLADASGNAIPITKDYRVGYADSAESKGLLNWRYRPLQDFKERHTQTTGNDLLAGLNLDYGFGKYLTAQIQYQYEWSTNDLSDLYDSSSYYTRDFVNRFTQDDGSGNLSFPIPKGGILYTANNTLKSQSGRFQLKYSNTWDKNDLAILAGTEIRDIRQAGNSHTTYGYNPSGLTSTPVDYTTLFPQYYDPGNFQGIPYRNNFIGLTNRYRSYYANAAYTYDQRYTLSASARKDESNIFGGNANNKGVPLWSAGLSWNLSNERFYPGGVLNYLKMRVTYGFNGNLPQNLTAVASLLQDNGNLNNQPFAIISTYPNPDLRWEKVAVVNAGFDFGSRNNVLTGSVEYYHKKASDLIGRQPIDQTVGIPDGFITRNVADMNANGIDIQLNGKIVDRLFKWTTGLLFNYNKDKVTQYNNSSTIGSFFINGGLGIAPVVGRPVSSIFSFKWAGLDSQTGDPMGIVNGQPSKDYSAIVYQTELKDLQYNGPATPPYFGNFFNTFSYKGFSLYVNIAYRFGYFFQHPSISYYYLYHNGNGHSDFAARWQHPGDESKTHIPSMPGVDNNSYERDYFYSYSSALVEKGDNIRLQDLNLSYSPKLNGWKRFPIRGLQLYAYARNVGILWKANKAGLDPDYASGYLPPSLTLSFGLKASF
ncbi:SusC/RagA family TonB-linked outer membrane protein [Mucilaginibacter sp. OK283]|jgi:TonB-linked SusC/RagA family outer membrane protein|uniref:SusC/RagA family TonB-linked outer membrane protein n=1 Tax=Mucilaginibacter sp. OK283 TaxID=1881049 RepID=UPI0008C1560A|nr:SusC/RagA family TonB-linked outer membrane protein [Mucilaginibacter sp. OK283]SEO79464.1 TonB-linked outer membrane protein, SusC/RagA family [Mucilaginibacter sp. OK283]